MDLGALISQQSAALRCITIKDTLLTRGSQLGRAALAWARLKDFISA